MVEKKDTEFDISAGWVRIISLSIGIVLFVTDKGMRLYEPPLTDLWYWILLGSFILGKHILKIAENVSSR